MHEIARTLKIGVLACLHLRFDLFFSVCVPVRAITCVCANSCAFFASKCVCSYVRERERESVCVCVCVYCMREREIAARTASEFALPVQHESCAGMGQPVIHCSR